MTLSLANILYLCMIGIVIICLACNIFISLVDDFKKTKTTPLFIPLFAFSFVSCFLVNIFDVEPYTSRNSFVFILIVLCSGISMLVTTYLFIILIKNAISNNIHIKFNAIRMFIVIVTIFVSFLILKWSIPYSKLINTLMWSDFLFAYQLIFLYIYSILCLSVSVSWIMCKLFNKYFR